MENEQLKPVSFETQTENQFESVESFIPTAYNDESLITETTDELALSDSGISTELPFAALPSDDAEDKILNASEDSLEASEVDPIFALPTNVKAGYDGESSVALINSSYAEIASDDDLASVVREEVGEHLAWQVSQLTGITFEGDLGDRLGSVLAGLSAEEAIESESTGALETTAIVNGELTTISAMAGTQVQVNASGDEGNEQFELLVRGESVGTYAVGTDFQNFSYQALDEVSADDVRVQFTNDQFIPESDIDLNLNVDFIDLDGRVFQTEDDSVFSSATWTNGAIQSGFGLGETLHANGYFQYSNGIGPDGSLVAVNAFGSRG